MTPPASVTDDTTKTVWDVAFVARDPQRAKDIDFTDAYVIIEGGVHGAGVRRGSRRTRRSIAPGVRIAVVARQRLRSLPVPRLSRARPWFARSSPQAAVETVLAKTSLDVAAGVKAAARGLRVQASRHARAARAASW